MPTNLPERSMASADNLNPIGLAAGYFATVVLATLLAIIIMDRLDILSPEVHIELPPVGTAPEVMQSVAISP
jgi:hypothetical protein